MAAAGIVEEPPSASGAAPAAGTARAASPASAAPAPAVSPAAAAAPAPTTPPANGAGGRGGGKRVELNRLQQLVARRMAEAKATIPHFQVQTEVEMSAAVAMRAQLKDLAAAQDTPVPSLNDLIVKASALALRRHPRANGSFVENGFALHPQVNVAIAVAADDALVAPVVLDADRKTIGQIAADTRRLIEAVRAGRVAPADLEGGTFTVSNLGMYGIDRFEGIINAPQAAILCVGAVADRPVAIDGELAIRPIASITLASDHRILYGADAAAFLADVRGLLENPLAMAL
jgi:pyruvate dehydrogenase E2 component (dihydrolipoamide acetyltransferase)